LHVNTTGQSGGEEAVELAVEGGDVQSVLLTLRGSVIGSHEEKMPAIGKEKRPAMGGVEFDVELGDRGGRAAAGGNLVDDIARRRSEQDDAAGAPGATARGRRVAKSADNTGGHFESLEFAIGEEADAGTVGSPEGADAAARTGQGALCAVAKGAEPELTAGAEDQKTTVR